MNKIKLPKVEIPKNSPALDLFTKLVMNRINIPKPKHTENMFAARDEKHPV